MVWIKIFQRFNWSPYWKNSNISNDHNIGIQRKRNKLTKTFMMFMLKKTFGFHGLYKISKAPNLFVLFSGKYCQGFWSHWCSSSMQTKPNIEEEKRREEGKVILGNIVFTYSPVSVSVVWTRRSASLCWNHRGTTCWIIKTFVMQPMLNYHVFWPGPKACDWSIWYLVKTFCVL